MRESFEYPRGPVVISPDPGTDAEPISAARMRQVVEQHRSDIDWLIKETPEGGPGESRLLQALSGLEANLRWHFDNCQGYRA